MKLRKDLDYQIITDGITVWVNGTGVNLGRFAPLGVDVHNPLSEQQASGLQCLYCTHERTQKEDFALFQAKILEHHGIKVSDKFLPKRFKENVKTRKKRDKQV
jgi:hypothetical protein